MFFGGVGHQHKHQWDISTNTSGGPGEKVFVLLSVCSLGQLAIA